MQQKYKKELYYIFIGFIISIIGSSETKAQNYPYKCSNKLEVALDHMMRRNQLKSGGRNLLDITPYSIYNSFYGNNDQHKYHDDDYELKDHRRRSHEDSERKNTILNQKLDNKFYEGQSGSSYFDKNHKPSSSLPISRVEVADLRVRLPNKAKWVQVDKCQFSATDRTLDTRLIFPDLTISGKVIIHPTGGKCNMILRLRRAGIEFRTIPMDESRDQGGSVSVRTDSHFAEPGFLSVFAHGCEGRNGIKVRQNSKRRLFERPPVYEDIQADNSYEGTDNTYRKNKSRYFMPPPPYPPAYNRYYENSWRENTHRRYDDGQDHFYDRDITGNYNRRKRQSEIKRFRQNEETNSMDNSKDEFNVNDDLLNMNDLNQDPDFKTFDEFLNNAGSLIFAGDSAGTKRYHSHNHQHKRPSSNKWYSLNENLNEHEFNQHHSNSNHNHNNNNNNHNNNNNNNHNTDISAADSEEINEALTNQLEQLFTIGVRSMLTTYMKKTLQPAIKETLMENMGYTISYG